MARALFDLDHTVLDHDSFGRFTVHLLRRNPLRAAGAVALAPVAAVLVNVPKSVAERLRARLTRPDTVQDVHWPTREDGS